MIEASAPPASDLRIGFVTGRLLHLGADHVWSDAGVARLIDAIAAQSGSVEVVACCTPARLEQQDTPMRLGAAAVRPIPVLGRFIEALPKTLVVRRTVRALAADTDVLVVQLPLQAPLALTVVRGPVVYHMFGDPVAMARDSSHYGGAGRLVALVAAAAVQFLQRRIVRRPLARLVSNGAAMQQIYAPDRARAVVSSALVDGDFVGTTRRRPVGAPYRILFVGYIRPGKGLDTLVAAYRLVLDELPDAELRIVGRGDVEALGPAFVEQLRSASEKGTVDVVGERPFGPDLFAEYADADVVALPSRSEGTPRVLVEARAFGCPVVASRVGGVPTSVDDGVDGLLVDPDDAAGLARGLLRLAHDDEERRGIVEEGRRRARRRTVDALAGVLLEEAVFASRLAAGPTGGGGAGDGRIGEAAEAGSATAASAGGGGER